MKTSSRFHRFVAFAFAALFAAASANAADTVLAHWPFTNGSLEDESGNGHTIEVGEAVVTSGGCLSFPADAAEGTSWAQTTDAITMSGSKNATVSLWFRQPTSTANASFLELSANPTGNVGAFRLGWLESWKVVVDYRATSGVNTRESTADRYDDGEWHQVVATMFIGGKKTTPTVTLYVDGKLDSTSTANANTANVTGGDTFTNDKFYFARRAGSEGTGGSFAGDIGEVAVYGEVLSAACMQTNYYRELGRVYKGDSAKYQSRLPDGWRVDAAGVFSYRVRVISEIGVRANLGEARSGTNDYWVVENESIGLLAQSGGLPERVAWIDVPASAVFSDDALAAEFAVVKPVTIHVDAFTPTHVWTGATSTSFKADANWADASGAETTAPGAYACVFIPVSALNQPTASEAISVGELRIGRLTNDTRTATFTSSTTAAHQIAGDVVIYAGGVMTHSTGTGIKVSCGGNMSIEKNGAVEADGKGNATDGRIGKNQSCASYGGRGGMQYSGLCYGNIREPTSLGSLGGGTNGKGGGVVRLIVSGILRTDGRIGSNGTYSNNGGSGGSVWLTVGSLVGAGSITALESTKNGGGGRIAIYQTATAVRTFAGVIDVDNGTLYREDLGDTQGVGELIFMGTGAGGRVTEIGTAIGGSERPFKKITFENAGQTLIIMDNIRVTVCGDIVANGNTVRADYTTRSGSSIGNGNMGSIDLLGTTEGVTHLSGTFTLGAFTCTNGTESLEIATGTKLTLRNDGILKLNGSAEKSMTMFSAEPSWSVTLGDNVDTAVKYVAVSNSVASPLIVDMDGTDLGGNTNWTFPSMPQLNDPIVWLGTNGTAWGSVANWEDKDGGNRLPIETDRVVINAGCPDYPTLSASGGAACHKLQIATGARLTIADTVVSFSGDVTCEGRLDLTGTTALSVGGDIKLSPSSLTMGLLTSLTLTGAGAQLADFGRNQLNRLTVASPSVTFTNGFAAVSFTCEQPRAVALRFSAGDTYVADSLRLTPGTGGSLTLDSTADGSCWNLHAGSGAMCDGVSVKDCDARGGYEIVVSSYDNRDNNFNWRVGTVSTWTGANGTAWDDPANWTGGVPTPGSDVRILPTETGNMPTLAGEMSIRSLTVGDGSGSFTLTLSKALTVADFLRVNSGATVVANQPVGVTNDVYVAAGAMLTHAYGANLKISCGGNMTIEKEASVDVDGKGSSTRGTAGRSQCDASHGGRGGWLDYNLACYGSIREPTDAGSEGGAKGNHGGGVVRLIVSGNLRVDGSIRANGQGSSSTGSGGSVWLTVGQLTGSGRIAALQEGHLGGGGRIAIYQTTAATRTAFTGEIDQGNGTLYREDFGDREGCGELILQGISGVTELSDAVAGSDRPFKKITFLGQGGQTLIIMDNIQVSVYGDIEASGNVIRADVTTVSGGTAGSGIMGGIDLLGAAEGMTRLSGNITLGAFTCTNGTETIEIATGTRLTLRDDGILKLNGSAEKLLTMFTAEPSWNVTLGDNVDTAVKYVAASNSIASSVIADMGGLDLGGNVNWTFPAMPQLDDPIVWLGTNGTAWGSAENWEDKDGGNRLPIETDRVVINAGCPDYPTLSASGGAACHKLQIAAGARLTIADTVVSFSGDVTCEGRLDLTGTTALSVGGDVKLSPSSLTMGSLTSLTLTGADAQLADFGGNRLNRLRVASPSVTFTNGFAAVSFTCEQPQRAVALRFSAGDTYAADSLRLTPGADGSLTLDSTTDGSCWNLIAGPGAACDGVSVKDCDARGGYEIVVSSYDNRDNNFNWRVGSVCAWTGANGTAWDDPANWTGGVPAETNDVRILPTATGNLPTLAGETSVRSLTVGDGSGSLALTLSKALTVADFLRVNGGATVVANQPVVVTNDVYVAAGATLTHSLGAKLDISCGGNMTIEKEGAVDVNEKGNSTKGRTNNNQSRTSYGGLGNLGLGCYGNIRTPNDLGSRGAYDSTMAGGAVRLTVAGTLRVEGRISSNGRRSGAESGDGAGSGGSVWLTVGSLAGGGSITAWEEARWGGGGRIAIYQTATATRTAFTGTICVDNGTLYREDLGDAPGVGELITQGTRVVELSKTVVGSSEPFKKITFEGAGQTMIIMDNIPVTVCGDILASGNAILADISNGRGTGNMGTIDVLGAAEGVTHVSGNITVGGFTCTNGTAALEFAAGRTLTVRDNGTLWLEGRDRQKLALKSSVPGEYWFINAGTNLMGRTRYLNVSDSDAHGGEKITARSSVGKRAHNDNWVFPSGIAIIIK